MQQDVSIAGQQIADAIAAAGIPLLQLTIRTYGDPTSVALTPNGSWSPQQQAQAETIVNAYDWLAPTKADACAAIDAKTAVLLAAGFAYDGRNFGLDPASVLNWHGVMLASAGLTYPFTIADTAGAAYQLASAAAVQAWYAAGVTRSAAIQQGGIAIKAQINAATSAAAIAAITDSRT